MTSLPLISHHLFVAAIGHEDRARVQPTRKESCYEEPAWQARAIPLEVLDGTQSIPGEATRPLRASVMAAKS